MAHKYRILKEKFITLIPMLHERLRKLTKKELPGACYSASVIAQRVFVQKGITSEIVFVKGVIENDAGKIYKKTMSDWEAFASLEPDRFVELYKKAGGHSLGLGMGSDESGKPNFHAVLHFSKYKDILDLTTYQFTRETQGILFANYFWGNIDDYMQFFSHDYPRELFVWRNFLETFTPMVVGAGKECNELVDELIVLLDSR